MELALRKVLSMVFAFFMAYSLCACSTSNLDNLPAAKAHKLKRQTDTRLRSPHIDKPSDIVSVEYSMAVNIENNATFTQKQQQDVKFCELYAGEKLAAAYMVESCSAAIGTPNISTRNLLASHYNRGVIYEKLEAFGLARADFEKAGALDPNFGDADLALASLDILTGEYETAEARVRAAQQKKVKHRYYTHYLLGEILEDQRRFSEAREAYRQALALRPFWREAQQRIDRINISWPEE